MPSGKDRSRLHPAAIAERWRNPPPVVPVLRLYGTIGRGGSLRSGMTLASMAGAIQKAFSTKRAVAVALSINSPGGSPVQSALIARRIRDLAAEKELPVLAFCEDVAASGGYWLATAADEIFVDESSVVGSIGVIAAGFGLNEAIGRYGVERRLYTSGERKSILDPFLPEKAEDVEKVRALQGEIHESFKDQVRDRRGDKLTAEEATLFSGEFWTGKAAVDLGLADALGHLRPVLRERYGDKVRMRPVESERGFLRRRIGLAARPGGLDADALAASAVREGLSAIEERALWQRYGL